MPRFTKLRKPTSTTAIGDYEPEIYILAVAKMHKISFAELNELTADDFLDIVEILTPLDEEEKQGTQQEIDKFF